MTVDERFDRIDQSIKALTEYVRDLRGETVTRLENVDNRLDLLTSAVIGLDSRFPPLTKALLDFGSLSSQLVREQSAQKNGVADLAARVSKLEGLVSKLIDPAA